MTSESLLLSMKSLLSHMGDLAKCMKEDCTIGTIVDFETSYFAISDSQHQICKLLISKNIKLCATHGTSDGWSWNNVFILKKFQSVVIGNCDICIKELPWGSSCIYRAIPPRYHQRIECQLWSMKLLVSWILCPRYLCYPQCRQSIFSFLRGASPLCC